MAILNSIIDRSRRNRALACLKRMSNRELEDVGVCRADLEKALMSAHTRK